MVARGYASLSFLHSAAEYINDLEVPAYIYHLGDFDPSGVNAGEKIEETLKELAPDAEIHFERIAVTEEQISEWDLPTRPTKTTDTRAKDFGAISVELDAIEPGQLRDLVQRTYRAAPPRRAVQGSQDRRRVRTRAAAGLGAPRCSMSEKPVTSAAWIMPSSAGTFQRLPEYEPGAVDADWLYVREWVPDPFEEVPEIIDCVAWKKGTRSPWWMWHGIAAHVGEHELRTAYWQDRPARLLETPQDFLACHGAGFCILDWTADVDAIIGAAPAVSCSTDDLAAKLQRVLTEQAKPRFPIIWPGLRRAA